MNKQAKNEKLFNFIFESTQSMTSDEIQYEFAEEGLNLDKEIDAFEQQLSLVKRKYKLTEAKNKLESKSKTSKKATNFIHKLKEQGNDAKSFLVTMMIQGKMPKDLTVAFREGEDISNNEAEGIIEDLINLGLIKDDKQEDNS